MVIQSVSYIIRDQDPNWIVLNKLIPQGNWASRIQTKLVGKLAEPSITHVSQKKIRSQVQYALQILSEWWLCRNSLLNSKTMSHKNCFVLIWLRNQCSPHKNPKSLLPPQASLWGNFGPRNWAMTVVFTLIHFIMIEGWLRSVCGGVSYFRTVNIFSFETTPQRKLP